MKTTLCFSGLAEHITREPERDAIAPVRRHCGWNAEDCQPMSFADCIPCLTSFLGGKHAPRLLMALAFDG